MNKRSQILFLMFLFLILPLFALAQNKEEYNNNEQIFEAKVEKILEERKFKRDDGSEVIQQNIQLKGLHGQWKDKEIFFQGIDDYEVVSANKYEVGDKVLVAFNSVNGEAKYYIIDYVRHQRLWWLLIFFIGVVIWVGGWKGVRSLIGLFLTFLIIIKLVVPKILAGGNPLLISIFGSLLILVSIIYLVEGFNKRSHLAILSILISLTIVGIGSIIFTKILRLTGMSQEEAMFLVDYGKGMINFKGLLLAGILIGALGVLDDVVISQITAVEEIKSANVKLNTSQVYRKAMKIGVSHMSSMVNTLFLAYASVSLPLLLLFNIKQPPFLYFHQVINNEMIATEIMRALVGSIGIILSVPISTFLAAYFLNSKQLWKK